MIAQGKGISVFPCGTRFNGALVCAAAQAGRMRTAQGLSGRMRQHCDRRPKLGIGRVALHGPWQQHGGERNELAVGKD